MDDGGLDFMHTHMHTQFPAYHIPLPRYRAHTDDMIVYKFVH